MIRRLSQWIHIRCSRCREVAENTERGRPSIVDANDVVWTEQRWIAEGGFMQTYYSGPRNSRWFQTMQTLLLLAQQGTDGGKSASDAMGELMQAHQRAIYGTIRMLYGHHYDSEAAHDATSRFIESFLRRKSIRGF